MYSFTLTIGTSTIKSMTRIFMFEVLSFGQNRRARCSNLRLHHTLVSCAGSLFIYRISCIFCWPVIVAFEATGTMGVASSTSSTKDLSLNNVVDTVAMH